MTVLCRVTGAGAVVAVATPATVTAMSVTGPCAAVVRDFFAGPPLVDPPMLIVHGPACRPVGCTRAPPLPRRRHCCRSIPPQQKLVLLWTVIFHDPLATGDW